MTSIYKVYRNFLFRYPIASQAVQTGILMGIGDISSQTLCEGQPIKKVDYVRTMQFFSVGAFFVGPVVRMWYGVLDKHVGHGGKMVALKKVALDQIVFAPICLGAVLTLVKTLHGNTLAETKNHLNEHYFDVLKANYQIWPAVQMVNFYFVPLHYQVVLVQVVAIFWNTFISYKTRPRDKSLE